MRKETKNLWKKIEWFKFSNKVKKRDRYKCLICERGSESVVLQVHHVIYIQNRKPWEYSLSDCRTLCRGCHAREHGLIEPSSGWVLLSVDDIGDNSGKCEREGCPANIRYEYHTYHPNWGYKIVGSTCIQHLTLKDRELGAEIKSTYEAISRFVRKSIWERDYSYEGMNISTKYKHDIFRVYGAEGNYSFQIFIKIKNRAKFEETKIIPAIGKTFEEIKELSYIVLKGKRAKEESKKIMLRELYRGIK